MIHWSLANRAIIIGMALVLMVMGLRTATELPVEVLPDLSKPTVITASGALTGIGWSSIGGPVSTSGMMNLVRSPSGHLRADVTRRKVFLATESCGCFCPAVDEGTVHMVDSFQCSCWTKHPGSFVRWALSDML